MNPVHVIDKYARHCARCEAPLPIQVRGRRDLEGCGVVVDPRNPDSARLYPPDYAYDRKDPCERRS